MDKIRVFLVDDSSVVRRMVSAALNEDAELEVAGVAADGRAALDRLAEVEPDVIVLDLEMPVMDGLETLVAVRKVCARLPVIMFSRFTHRGVEATVKALTLGADDYVPKPGDGLDVRQCVEGLLIPKIKLLAERRGRSSGFSRAGAAAAKAPPSAKVAPAAPRKPVEIVVIGASTGGPNALAEVMPAFPDDWSIPIVVVQHMPAEFTARLADRLSEKSRLVVREGRAGEPLAAAQAWIAPGGYHLVLERKGDVVELALNQEPPVNSCRPAVDVLFRSAAETFGDGVLAVVLTGMGQDGLLGAERVKAAGGQIIVQDEPTSVVWSMPGAVAQAGLADQVLPLKCVSGEIISRAARLPRARQGR